MTLFSNYQIGVYITERERILDFYIVYKSIKIWPIWISTVQEDKLFALLMIISLLAAWLGSAADMSKNSWNKDDNIRK